MKAQGDPSDAIPVLFRKMRPVNRRTEEEMGNRQYLICAHEANNVTTQQDALMGVDSESLQYEA